MRRLGLWGAGAVLALAGSAGATELCYRTPELVSAVEAKVGKVCDEVTPQELAEIQHLDLSGKGISLLQEDDFEGMDGLFLLQMEGNPLSGLPARIFRPVQKLQLLALRSNQFRSLPAGIFRGLDKLVMLELSENRLEALPAGIFEGLTSLSVIGLFDNGLAAPPVGLFSGLPRLMQLELGGSALTTDEQERIRSEVPADCSVSF